MEEAATAAAAVVVPVCIEPSADRRSRCNFGMADRHLSLTHLHLPNLLPPRRLKVAKTPS
ncbi:hypothetical protein T12_3860 [Trichinella patagoniensis]|uniref:Uncharacterized protein n=1 Tax=Trichinella patagoniensis TaxID=990121 RepID=A0A0V1A4S1_9BILA|nr:hypothetical protein T12_3860 [Trichinella patagoniensis]